VDYRTEDGTANAGSDFTFATGTLIFQPGETERHIEISIIDDDVFEEDEHFFVNLNNVRNEGDTEATTGQPRIRPCTDDRAVSICRHLDLSQVTWRLWQATAIYGELSVILVFGPS